MKTTIFQPASKANAKLRLAIPGVSGSGKSYTALSIATAMAREQGGKVCVIDTEANSASKYADDFEFEVLPIGPKAIMPDGTPSPFQSYHPDNFTDAIQAAEDEGCTVLIIDSLSHEWQGTEGVLDQKTLFAQSKAWDGFTAWKPAGDMHQNVLNAILFSRMHVIVTFRSKQQYIVEEFEKSNGHRGSRPVMVGLGPITRGDTEYEFDIILTMDDTIGTITKSRATPAQLQKSIVYDKPGEQLAEQLMAWLQGQEPPERPTYQDGTLIDIFNSKEMGAWREFCDVANRKPDNRAELRGFVANGNQMPAPTPTAPTPAAPMPAPTPAAPVAASATNRAVTANAEPGTQSPAPVASTPQTPDSPAFGKQLGSDVESAAKMIGKIKQKGASAGSRA